MARVRVHALGDFGPSLATPVRQCCRTAVRVFLGGLEIQSASENCFTVRAVLQRVVSPVTGDSRVWEAVQRDSDETLLIRASVTRSAQPARRVAGTDGWVRLPARRA